MSSSDSSRDERLTSDEITAIAAEAYVFSFPMLMGYRFVSGRSSSPRCRHIEGR